MSAARKTFLAVDLGASGGRVMAGHFDGSRLEIEEAARFPNSGLQTADGWHWDSEGLFKEITQGLAAAGERFGGDIVSVAVDTWGVDYALLGPDGAALNEPWMYRDSRTDGMIPEAARLVGEEKIWSRTGIQPLFFNTIYQLMAESRLTPQALKKAQSLLFMPDYLNYRLCGVKAIERTIASTSGLLRAGTAEWDAELAGTLGIPGHILGQITEPGVILGELTEALAAATGLRGVKVTTCGSHDTASAVAGVPSRSNPLFLSSGTWSLLGIELAAPVLSQEAFDAKFSNEQGLEGTTRFLTNIAGMWLLQECRRVWAEQGHAIEYSEMVEMARNANATALIDPDAPEFGKPCDMPQAILDWIKKNEPTHSGIQGRNHPRHPGEPRRQIQPHDSEVEKHDPGPAGHPSSRRWRLPQCIAQSNDRRCHWPPRGGRSRRGYGFRQHHRPAYCHGRDQIPRRGARNFAQFLQSSNPRACSQRNMV